MDGDSRQPGGELCPSGELAQVLVGAQERILDDILGLRRALQDAARHPVQPRAVPPDEDFEQIPFTAEDPLPDLVIAHPSGVLLLLHRWPPLPVPLRSFRVSYSAVVRFYLERGYGQALGKLSPGCQQIAKPGR